MVVILHLESSVTPSWQPFNGFGSMHGAGINFCYGDASVHTVPRSTDWMTLYNLMGAFDGQTDINIDY